jgi:5-methylcytosine-specific restriction endonuclease McrA
MATLGLSVTKKDRKTIARDGYHRWRTYTKTAKVYLGILFAMCEGVCPLCGEDMILSFNQQENERPNSATLDHVTPLAEVMEHSKYNLQIMCKRCNVEKD